MSGMRIFAFIAALFGAPLAYAQAPDPAAFARDPFVSSIALSPDGAHVAMIQRTESEHQLVIFDTADRSSTLIQRLAADRGSMNWVFWKGNGRLMLGIEAYRWVRTSLRRYDYSVERVVAVDRDGRSLIQMFQGSLDRLASARTSSTRMLDTLPHDPTHVLLSAVDATGVGVWRANVVTGAVERVLDGDWSTAGYLTDGRGIPVLRVDWLQNGRGWRILSRAPGEVHWSELLEARAGADPVNSPDFQPISAAPGAGKVYVLARPEGHDLLNLYLFDTAVGALSTPLQEGVRADVSHPWIDPATRALLATCEHAERRVCTATDPALQRHLDAVQAFVGADADISLLDTSANGARWLLRAEGPSLTGGYYVYDLTTAHAEPIALDFPELTSGLAPTHVERFHARDGAALWAYVTAQSGEGPRPTIIMPHGGPESRDTYGFDFFAQFLAAKGYVVIQPNFRGSNGFGRGFAETGYGQWGGLMQNDVTDAVRHMTETGVTDPSRICVVGASYGGYVALAGLMLTPDLYRCAISIAGVTHLPEILRDDRSRSGRSSMTYQYWLRSIGDPSANRDALIAASPARHADAITAPVLLIHGEDDGNVPIRQSELMDEALRAAGREVRLVRLPDSGHVWANWSTEHRLTMLQETESFLNQHLH